MDRARRAELNRIMGEMVDDEAKVIELYQEFHAEIAAVVGFLARKRLRSITDEEVEAMVFDTCGMLGRVARSWRPDGGALPWVWARSRIVALVGASLPLRHDPLPDEHDLPPAPPLLSLAGTDEPEVDLVLERLALADERVALLVVALHEAVGVRDGGIWLRYRMQQQAGDPSPAHTVGGELGLLPPTVRQRASRARRRLARHVEGDPRFADLADLPLLVA